MRNKIALLSQIFSSYVSVFILGYSHLGVILALITCLHPNIGVCGLIGLAITAMLLKLLSITINSPLAKAILRNNMLVGLLIGDLFVFQPAILPFIALAMLFNLALTAALEAVFSTQRLPVVSLPFCISALIIFMIKYNLYEVAHFGNATVLSPEFVFYHYLPAKLLPLFRAVSSILCIRDASIGLLILCFIAIISPLTAFFIVSGFFIGTFAESFLHIVNSNPLLYSEGYNYSLVFAAIAGFLMVPSYASFLLASCAVIITSAIILACDYIFHPFYLPILSIPFNFIFLVTLLSLRVLRPSGLSNILYNSPEHSLENDRLLRQRHRFGEVGIFFPAEGAWKIQQGFDGEITHRGFWKHALDFVAVDKNGQVFYNKGLELDDYIAFGKEVLSPIDGHVVACSGLEPDNLIGQVKNCKNWGNYVIIMSYDGICVTLAHLKYNSVIVNVGDKVNVGQKLGECGNSGYSQEPHLHLQVQIRPEIGSATIPFHLINYRVNNHIYFHRTPLVNETLVNLKLNHAVSKALNFKIGEEMLFSCEGGQKNTVTLTHEMDGVTGRLYFTDGASRLYFTKVGLQCYFYGLEGAGRSPLWDLFASAPKIPMTYSEEFTYTDELPLCLTQGVANRFLSYIRLLLKLPVTNAGGKYKLNKHGLEISGSCYQKGKLVETFFRLDPVLGIQEFSSGKNKYIRISSAGSV